MLSRKSAYGSDFDGRSVIVHDERGRSDSGAHDTSRHPHAVRHCLIDLEELS